MTSSSAGAGPGTHYELFAGLRDGGVAYLVTGATALTLHGLPRLTPDVDLAVDPLPANIERLERLLAGWGYGEPAPPEAAAGGGAVRRFRHPTAALGEIDAILPPPGDFERRRAGSTVVTLVDLAIPLVGTADLRAIKGAGAAADRADAAGLETLAAVLAGGQEGSADTLRVQIGKFSRWSVGARLDWLLAAARLHKGLTPEARPMTRGLVRRRPWTQRRG